MTLFLRALAGLLAIQSPANRTLSAGVLEMHILPQKESIEQKEVNRAVAALYETGPDAKFSESLRWFPVQERQFVHEASNLITQERDGRVYVLAKTDPDSSLDARTPFQIVHVEKEEKKPPFGWVINFEFDEGGAAQLRRITSENIKSVMGTFIEGKMSSYATIMDPIGGSLALSGTPESIESTYQTLAKHALAIQPPAAKSAKIKCAYRADLAPAVKQALAAAESDLLAYYKDLHATPELSNQETQTARKIGDRLTTLGYKVTTAVGGTGVVGLLDNGPGPTLLIRGDMDALPIVEETGLPYASTVTAKRDDGHEVGVMHACGHDMHQTVLLGTARLLAELKDKWRGKLLIVAQPAEEIGSGARAMIKDGLFDRFGKPDYCIALHVSSSHPAGVIAYTPGWALANVDSFDITIHGRGGHGSRPNEAVDPIVMAAHVVTALQTIVSRRVNPQDPAVITVGSIHAGSKHNIIPDSARLEITVRSYKDEVRKTLLEGIRQVTVNTCRALGAERDPDVVLRESEFTPSTFNDPALAEAAAEVFRKVLGEDRVLHQEPVMGGEDFSEYGRATGVPSFLFWLGSVPQQRYDASLKPGAAPLPSIHSSKYYPDPQPTAQTGVSCMASLAFNLLATP